MSGGGVNTSYGVDRCNELLRAARQLAGADKDAAASLDQITPLNSILASLVPARIAAEANVFLAELKGVLRALIALHMDKVERERLGV